MALGARGPGRTQRAREGARADPVRSPPAYPRGPGAAPSRPRAALLSAPGCSWPPAGCGAVLRPSRPGAARREGVRVRVRRGCQGLGSRLSGRETAGSWPCSPSPTFRTASGRCVGSPGAAKSGPWLRGAAKRTELPVHPLGRGQWRHQGAGPGGSSRPGPGSRPRPTSPALGPPSQAPARSGGGWRQWRMWAWWAE